MDIAKLGRSYSVYIVVIYKEPSMITINRHPERPYGRDPMPVKLPNAVY